MKSKTSCFNKTIFTKNVTHFWPIWVVLLLFYLFLFPFMECNYFWRIAKYDVASLAKNMEQSILLPEMTQVFINPVFLYFLSLIAAGAVFSYLYTSRASYTIHALPVTRKSLFITNYLSGLAFLWVPQIIGALLGILVGAGCGFNYIDILFKGLLYTLGLSFFFFSFNVFVGMVVGQLIAMPVFSFILNFLFVGCKALFSLLFSVVAFGITLEYWESKLDVLSPLYYITGKVYVDINYRYEAAECIGIIGGAVVAGYAAAAIVLAAAAYLIYQKRQIETAGSLISVKWVMPIFRWGVGACGAFLFALLAQAVVDYASVSTRFVVMVIAAVIFGGIFFFAAQMLLEKSFRVFQTRRFRECGIFVAVLAVILLFIRGDVLGIEKRVPDADDVKGAYVSYLGNYAGGEEGIDEIITLHKNILSHKKEYMDKEVNGQEYGGWVSVKYYLKNDSILYRSYYVPVLSEKDFSDESSPASQLVNLLTTPEFLIKSVCGMNYEDNAYSSGAFYSPVKEVDEDGSVYHSTTSHVLTAQQAQAISQAFIKDVEEGNYIQKIKRAMDIPDEEYSKSSYWNSIQLEFTNKKGYQTYENMYDADKKVDLYYDRSIYISFDTNCRNIINALIEEGLIESENDLRTSWDIDQEEKLTDK